MKQMIKLAVAGALAFAAGSAYSQAKEIKIAHVYDKTGVLEAYAKQTQAGLMMGLEYATGGKMEVLGRKIVVIEKDSQFKPDVGKAQLAAAYGDDKVDLAIGPTGSGVALAMLSVAEEYKKILLVEPAVADSITGDKWNRYIFRTGRSSSQDAISNAVALGKANTSIATLAQDYAFGRDGIKAFKDALAGTGANIVHEEYAPVATSDFTAPAERLFNALKDKPGRKVIFIIWAGGGGNPFKLAELNPGRFGIRSVHRRQYPAGACRIQSAARHGRRDLLLLRAPKNAVNQWLVSEHRSVSSRRRISSGGGMSAGIAAVEASKPALPIPKADHGDGRDVVRLTQGRMTFRKEDHRAMQSMYHFKIKVDPNVAWAIPELVREIKPEEMKVPVRNKR